jgi:hypothetical protein
LNQLRTFLLTAALCVAAPSVFAQGYERTPPPASTVPKPASCDDVAVTQQLQTLLLLTQQLQATGQIATNQIEILSAIQRIEAAQHPAGVAK